jgi:hypothetical protein
VSREGTALSDGNAHGPADVRSGIATAAAYDSARSSTGRLTTNSELLCRGEASADRARLSTADRATARRLKPAEPAAHARTCPADTEAAADLGEGVVCPAVSAYGNLLYSHPCPSDPVELVARPCALSFFSFSERVRVSAAGRLLQPVRIPVASHRGLRDGADFTQIAGSQFDASCSLRAGALRPSLLGTGAV